MRGRVLPATLLVIALAAGCSASDPTALPDATASPTSSPTAATPSPDESSTPSPSPDATPSPSPLAGEPYDGPPLNGSPATLAVVGVAAGDVLNVRRGPGTDAEVVATLAPLATTVAATGRARLLPESIWLEVAVDGTLGWSNSSFFAFLGGTDDITSDLLDDLDERPGAPTMEGLARAVGGLAAPQDPPPTVVISDGPSVGDLGEVTVDVIGLRDDAQRGLRLVVFATVEADGFTLRTVEATMLCGRGVTDDGRCV